jgi:DNA mismatch repair protein MutS2
MNNNIIKKLDLEDYIKSLDIFFAREKSVVLQGDITMHFKLINEISMYNFKDPKKIINLDSAIMILKKHGILKLYEIFEFIKIVDYFTYIQKFTLEGKLGEWIEKIIIPKSIENISDAFNDKGDLKQGINDDFDRIEQNIYNNKVNIKDVMQGTINTKKIQAYLVDHQVHLVHNQQAMLVRGGYNHILKAKVIERSQSGFFYVVPNNVEKLKQKQNELLNIKEEIVFKISKQYSDILFKNIMFLSFINIEFDRFDHYLARVNFAKKDDKNFILPKSNSNINKLVDFIHPALSNAKSISIDFSKSVIMITGVNAGGKTMLLKSILSASYLSKYLIPYKAHTDTKIDFFKNIVAVLDDPQSVKNDISTFAGRMQEFSKLFSCNNTIVGIDEIELGTDSDEAASLFKVIIENLMKKNIKIIITTHHKRLAALMASYDEVELIAALYDEQNRKPTYDFLQGTIGQSYAFETALRYGIPNNIVQKAKKVYGDDKENLNDLIHRSSILELEYQKKLKILDEKIYKYDRLNLSLQEYKESIDKRFLNYKENLSVEYKDAINEAKKAIKSTNKQEAHKLLNIAHKKKQQIKEQKVNNENLNLKVGDRVKYNSIRGSVISLKKNKVYFQSDDGIKIQVPISSLKKSVNLPKVKAKQKVKINIQKPNNGYIKLDLHGQKSEEACLNLDKFLSDCLINGFEEVLVYHGIGTGKLSYAVKIFLDSHPSVKEYLDAPQNQGGFGAKIIRF